MCLCKTWLYWTSFLSNVKCPGPLMSILRYDASVSENTQSLSRIVNGMTLLTYCSLHSPMAATRSNMKGVSFCDRFRSTNSPTSLATRDTSHRNLAHLKRLLRKSTKPTTSTHSNYTCNSAIYTKTLATEITATSTT